MNFIYIFIFIVFVYISTYLWVYVSPNPKRLLSPSFRATNHLSRPPVSPALRRISKSVTEELLRVADRQVISGEEEGVSISVYFRGEAIASVCAGRFRDCSEKDSKWQPVVPETRFMGYSVSKGVTAAAMLAMNEGGILGYEDPVVKYWKNFALSSTGKRKITIEEALSHRAGLQGTPVSFMLSWLWTVLGESGPQALTKAWKKGEQMIVTYPPDWIPGTYAKYHPLSFSWLVGGIVRRACKDGKGINHHLHSRVCAPLGIDPSELTIGELPPKYDVHVARLEGKSFRKLCQLSPIWKSALGVFESFVFCTVGNLRRWRELCLPSSNALWTPDAVAKMYAALSNDGAIACEEKKEKRAFSRGSIKKLWNKLHQPPIPGANGPARLSLGFCPWVTPSLHGPSSIHRRIVCHNGMGGCIAFGELKGENSETSSLAVAIGKNSYDPSVCIGLSPVSPSSVELVEAIRRGIRKADAFTA